MSGEEEGRCGGPGGPQPGLQSGLLPAGSPEGRGPPAPAGPGPHVGWHWVSTTRLIAGTGDGKPSQTGGVFAALWMLRQAGFGNEKIKPQPANSILSVMQRAFPAPWPVPEGAEVGQCPLQDTAALERMRSASCGAAPLSSAGVVQTANHRWATSGPPHRETPGCVRVRAFLKSSPEWPWSPSGHTPQGPALASQRSSPPRGSGSLPGQPRAWGPHMWPWEDPGVGHGEAVVPAASWPVRTGADPGHRSGQEGPVWRSRPSARPPRGRPWALGRKL